MTRRKPRKPIKTTFRRQAGTGRWIGPRETDMDGLSGGLLRPVPPARWPYGLPDAHEDCCILHSGGLYCDCAASDASVDDYGARA